MMTAMIAPLGISLMPFMLIFCFILPLGLMATAFWIWMLVSAIQNKSLGEGEKVAWVLVIALLHLLGALLYLIIGFPKRNLPRPAI